MICEAVLRFCQNVYVNENLDKFSLDHVGLETRSQGKVVEKSCKHNRGHTCGPVSLHLDKMSFFEIELSGVKTSL